MSISQKSATGVKTHVSTNNGMILPNSFRVVAGPCTIESYEQFAASAKPVKEAGYEYIRGGAFKPRTSPYSFQGLGEEGLKILSEVSGELGLKAVTEVLDPGDIEIVMEHAQILQIGARNMANFALLKRVGAAIAGTDHGVVLKRGFSATVEEWLLAAEYITSAGGDNVVLCERGIRTFETSTRFTLDLSAGIVAEKGSGLPGVLGPPGAGKFLGGRFGRPGVRPPLQGGGAHRRSSLAPQHRSGLRRRRGRA